MNDKKFNKAIESLTKKGIVIEIGFSELNPVFYQYDFNTDFFNIITVQEVMKLFNEHYKKDNYYTYLDVGKELIRVNYEDIEDYYQYKKNISKLKYDMDIDVLTGELSVYLSVYNQMYREVNLDEINLSDYGNVKQIMINNHAFSNGHELFIYDVDTTRFSTLNDNRDLFSDKVFEAITNNSDKLIQDLIKIDNLIEQYNSYWENKKVFEDLGAYETIKRVIRKIKEA